MLAIRNQQMASLENQRRLDIAKKYIPFIRSHYQQYFRFYNDEQLFVWVDRQLMFLFKHQINTETAIKKLLGLLAIFGERFERCTKADYFLKMIQHDQHCNTKANVMEHDAIELIDNGNAFI